jgi:hypothetical protein
LIIWYGTQILPFLYDKEIVSEDAILRWAEEKEHADESDKVFVKQSEAFIQVYVLYNIWFLVPIFAHRVTETVEVDTLTASPLRHTIKLRKVQKQ